MTLGLLLSGNLGFEMLQKLGKHYAISFVLTDSMSSQIIDYCIETKTPIFKGNPRNGKAFNFIINYDVEVIISINYLFLIKEDIINHADVLTFNIHGSLLPRYRGRTPHVWAIINNEKHTGITAHEIDAGCDTGRIIKQVKIPIEQNDTGAILLEKFKDNYFPIIKSVIKSVEKGTIVFTVQNDLNATYFGKRTPEDGLINWNWQRERIRNWVRAQSFPYPGAFTFLEDKKLIIDEISFSNHGFNSEKPNGTILDSTPNLIVKTSNGAIEITKSREKLHTPIGSILK